MAVPRVVSPQVYIQDTPGSSLSIGALESFWVFSFQPMPRLGLFICAVAVDKKASRQQNIMALDFMPIDFIRKMMLMIGLRGKDNIFV